MIGRIDSSELVQAAALIREAFAGIAEQFELTPANCPSHPAFMTDAAFAQAVSGGAELYGVRDGVELVGLVLVQKMSDAEATMERLAVSPARRHDGIGRLLCDVACVRAREMGCQRMVIGIIDENTILKDWYLGMGFEVTEVKRYPHLPFTVCLMEKSL